MLKYILRILMIVNILFIIGCVDKSEIDINSFSYNEAEKTYGNEKIPGVKLDGFKNTTEVEIMDYEDAIERAKIECVVEYNQIDVAYDEESEVWRISFCMENYDGGDQNVYLDNNGITLMSVCGE